MDAAMKKLAFKAVSLGLSMLGGSLAGAIVKRGWKLAAGEDEAPKATDQSYGWRTVLIAAAFQGAVFAVVKAALDRAESARKLTGTWPDD
ncbi:MAG: DUF4235 domain-containing protein [Streptosporangiaceae bacterium]